MSAIGNGLAGSGLAPLPSLARAPYNSRVNEGRITDVKLQKRLMAGRAGVLLLRHCVVLIVHFRRHYLDWSSVLPR
ncbi:hypothetical protein [Streptomyces wuyuanensis]|uniref:hypothetical protein n=1 Tax=Streptomyces wuyuanensis TaxID=1196353 RepID=UPI0036C765B1